MKRVVIIGANGLVGSSLIERLKIDNKYELIEVNRQNIVNYKAYECDILINANGSGKKGWCNSNPKFSYELNTQSCFEYLMRFKTRRYILISTVDVYNEPSEINKTEEKYDFVLGRDYPKPIVNLSDT